MRLTKLLSTAAAVTLMSGILYAAPFQVDLAHSSVGFKVKHLMISNVKGDFSKFSGSYDLENGTLKSLQGVVQTASIDTGIDKRDDHLRSTDFFDAARYPEMTFEMISVKGDTITGDLTIRGVTKRVTFDAEISGTVKDPWGNTRSSVSMSGKINRKEFGLKYNQLMEAGGMTVGEIVTISIELEGIEQK